MAGLMIKTYQDEHDLEFRYVYNVSIPIESEKMRLIFWKISAIFLKCIKRG